MNFVAKKQIGLGWQDTSTNEGGFKIYRSNGGLAGRRTYYYRVSAYNTAGESGPSNTVSATMSR